MRVWFLFYKIQEDCFFALFSGNHLARLLPFGFCILQIVLCKANLSSVRLLLGFMSAQSVCLGRLDAACMDNGFC